MATPLTIYPVNAFASLISTATKVVDTGSGTTSSAFDNAILGTATGWSELFIKGPSQAWQSLGSPGAPSGHGGLLEVTYLEGQDIVAGNWTPSLRTKGNGATASVTADLAYRLYLYNTGTYTLIGTCTLAAQTVTSASINFVWGATSLPKMSFITGDKLYFDIWANVTSNPNTLGTAPFRSDIATSTTVGETTTQVVTPGYAPTIKPLYAPFGVPRALGATIMPQVIQPPLIYTPRALGATLLAESRTFVPRALGGVYIPDDPTLLWV